jgi:NADPH-dependent curcumin reductase CurA
MSDANHQIRLAARPSGLPTDENWEHTIEPVPTPGAGEVLVQISHISIDPAMRGWMNAGTSYIPPVEVGAVMRAATIGEVLASQDDGFTAGDHVYGALGVQEFAVAPARELTKVDPGAAPLPTYLVALGLTGLTAYFGLLDVGRVAPGDTVLVSGAAGAVGSVVGQIAKIKGARAVGIAGGADKCRWLTEELGFDGAIDYKGEDVIGQLRRLTPDRVNVFFDNVGGEILEAALTRLARGARVVLCGAVSQYNAENVKGPSNYLALLVFRASMTGMVVFDYESRFGEARTQLAQWLAEGRLIAREQVLSGGIGDFPDALLALFRGENTGKLVLALR